MAGLRSLLYVPGGDERKLAKAALGLGADAVILDLEDAVPPDRKDEARRLVARVLGEYEWEGVKVCVRINGVGSPFAADDIAWLARLDRVDCVVLPKAERGHSSVIYKLTGKPVMPIIETPRGFMEVADIVGEEGVIAVNWGPADLASYIGGSLHALEQAEWLRLVLSLAAHSVGVDPIDKVYFKIDDLEGLREDCLKAKSLGYTGKTVVHPSHVKVVNEVFTPSREEVEWAKRVVRAYKEAAQRGLGAVKVEGELIDAVHYRIALKILERAGVKP